MTPKQSKFVDEYMIDLNATKAAIRAGYSEKTATRIGPKLVGKSCVQDAISAAQAKQSARTQITADRVVLELARIAFVDTRQIFKWGPDGVRLLPSDGLSDDEAAIVAEVSETISKDGGSIKAKRFDKLKALELLGRHLGMFKDKLEVDATITPASILEALDARGDNRDAQV
ncbi:MAG: terminase small subunit [Synergistaceae bacterium]|jgi:phage terminase small subunit|nr:terminase small subunit [Synergistaceae bacterium]